MEPKFERVKKAMDRKSGKISATLYQRGLLNFSGGANGKKKFGDFTSVSCLYDRTNDIVGFQLTNNSDKDSALLCRSRSSVAIFIKSFLNRLDLSMPVKRIKFVPVFDTVNNMILIKNFATKIKGLRE